MKDKQIYNGTANSLSFGIRFVIWHLPILCLSNLSRQVETNSRKVSLTMRARSMSGGPIKLTITSFQPAQGPIMQTLPPLIGFSFLDRLRRRQNLIGSFRLAWQDYLSRTALPFWIITKERSNHTSPKYDEEHCYSVPWHLGVASPLADKQADQIEASAVTVLFACFWHD